MDATPIESLPDDPRMLKEMLIRELARRDQELEQVKQEAARLVEALKQKHQAELESILRRFYGPKSERFDPNQFLLFGDEIINAPIAPADQAAVEQESGEKLVARRVRHKHGRSKLPESLPRIPIEHDLTDEEKKCPCCGEERVRIGRETTEQLEYLPASFKVLEHIQYKYACKACGQGCEKCDAKANIELAEKPAQPIDKGLPGPGLLAYVITSKLGDHLPLYRLEHMFDRQEVHIARSTLCAWLLSAGDLVQPLVDLMANRVRQGKVIHTDDTRIAVQDERVEGKCKSGRIWAYIGDADHPYTVYDYTPDRTRAGPSRWLGNFKGYLQADAYGGYDGIYATGVKEVACWAHCRRHFFEAKETDARRSAWMLGRVRDLYQVEEEAKEKISADKGATPEQSDARRLELRQEKSVPILNTIKDWLDENQNLVLPRSPMAAAIGYALNQWDALNTYTMQGFLNIDNNAAERAMRRVGIGRKNWLFAGHDAAARRTATLYTLIAGAERHKLNPQTYLTGVLARIPSMPLSQLETLLPDRWEK